MRPSNPDRYGIGPRPGPQEKTERLIRAQVSRNPARSWSSDGTRVPRTGLDSILTIVTVATIGILVVGIVARGAVDGLTKVQSALSTPRP